MLRIPKRDAFIMRKLCGNKSVHKSHSKHPTYYLVENNEYLKIYKEQVGNFFAK